MSRLQRVTRLHYNWKYSIFLRSTIDQVVKRYVRKFGKSTMASFLTSADGPSAEWNVIILDGLHI